MSSARTLIATQELGSSAAGISLTSIPSTYDDLLLKFSLRSNRAAGLDGLSIKFNNSSSNYVHQVLIGFGNNTTGYVEGGGGEISSYALIGNTETTGLFSQGELQINSYSLATTKNISLNWFGTWVGITTGRWTDTATVNSINLSVAYGTGFLAGSTVSLYGVTNGSSGGVTTS